MSVPNRDMSSDGGPALYPAGTVFQHPRNPNIFFTIPIDRIPCPLTKGEPTVLDGANLSNQLNSIGLQCPDAEPEKTQQYIDQVNKNIPIGLTQSFHIDKLTNNQLLSSLSAEAQVGNDDEQEAMPDPEWWPQDAAWKYTTKLAIVANPPHFDALLADSPDFKTRGHKSAPINRAGKYGTVQAIKDMFQAVAIESASSIVTGVNTVTLNAVFANIINPIENAQIQQYDSDVPYGRQNRLIFLVLGVQPGAKEVDGIGIIHIEWRLTISDYRKKSKDTPTHDTNLTITTRAVLYSDADVLDNDVAWVKQRFPPASLTALKTVRPQKPSASGGRDSGNRQSVKTTKSNAVPYQLSHPQSQSRPTVSVPSPPLSDRKSYAVPYSMPASSSATNPMTSFLDPSRLPAGVGPDGMPIDPDFRVWETKTLPVLNDDVFNTCMPVESTGQKLTRLIFYAPDLMCLAMLSNLNSKSSSTYSVATTSGFSFSMTEKIGASLKAAAGVIFAKAEATISFEVSFTEQWNSSQTETIAFQVPAGAEAYVYKGTLATRYVYFDTSSYKYSYGADGVFHTNYIVSSNKPLTGDPIYPPQPPPKQTSKTLT